MSVRIEFGGFAIVSGPGIIIRTPWHEAFMGHVEGPARFDCWRADGALYVRFGRRELVANRLPGSDHTGRCGERVAAQQRRLS